MIILPPSASDKTFLAIITLLKCHFCKSFSVDDSKSANKLIALENVCIFYVTFCFVLVQGLVV